MSGLLPALHEDWVRLLCVTLLHFLWQGGALALILKFILRGSYTPQARYRWSMITLAAMGVTPVVTFVILQTATRNGGFGLAPTPDFFAGRWEGWVVGMWMFGVAALAARALGELGGIYSLRRDAVVITGGLARRCADLCAHMAPGWKVSFKVSSKLDSPVVVGWIKPVVLIPVAALTRLRVEELESLVLHELAHIRRLDPFFNLAQIVVETLLFYHPAVWWVSRHARNEREHCCDDLAVSVIGSPASYVRALANIEEARVQLRMAMALNGGGATLSARAKRLLLGGGRRQGVTFIRVLSFILVVGITALGWGTMRGPSRANATASTDVVARAMPDQAPTVLGLLRQSANIAIGMPPALILESQPKSAEGPSLGASQPTVLTQDLRQDVVEAQALSQPSQLAIASPPREGIAAPYSNDATTPAAVASGPSEAELRAAERRASEIARQMLVVQQAASTLSLADAAVVRAQLDVEKTIIDLQKAASKASLDMQPSTQLRSALASRVLAPPSSQEIAKRLIDQPIGRQFVAQMAVLDEARRIRAQAHADQTLAADQLDAMSSN